jgi:hypothetical protein
MVVVHLKILLKPPSYQGILVIIVFLLIIVIALALMLLITQWNFCGLDTVKIFINISLQHNFFIFPGWCKAWFITASQAKEPPVSGNPLSRI